MRVVLILGHANRSVVFDCHLLLHESQGMSIAVSAVSVCLIGPLTHFVSLDSAFPIMRQKRVE